MKQLFVIQRKELLKYWSTICKSMQITFYTELAFNQNPFRFVRSNPKVTNIVGDLQTETPGEYLCVPLPQAIGRQQSVGLITDPICIHQISIPNQPFDLFMLKNKDCSAFSKSEYQCQIERKNLVMHQLNSTKCVQNVILVFKPFLKLCFCKHLINMKSLVLIRYSRPAIQMLFINFTKKKDKLETMCPPLPQALHVHLLYIGALR